MTYTYRPKHDPLSSLVSTLSTLTERAFEHGPDAQLGEPLLGELRAFAEAALAYLVDLQDAFDPPPRDSFEEAGSGVFAVPDIALESRSITPAQAREIADLAFVGALHLHERREELRRLSEGSTEAVRATVDAILRSARKGLTAVEEAMAVAEGRTPRLCFEAMLETSLRTRLRYAQIRDAILGGGTPTSDTLRPRLRRVGTRFAMVVGDEIYRSLRPFDRTQLQALQGRILAWLADPDDVAGRRLWEDLVGFASMLARISARHELQVHDRRLLEAFDEAISPASFAAWRARAEALRGLDPALDRTLDRPAATREDWIQVVAWLRHPRVASDSTGHAGTSAHAGGDAASEEDPTDHLTDPSPGWRDAG